VAKFSPSTPAAQEVTGFREEDVKGKFWVDILISPDKRAASQRRFSRWLKGGRVGDEFSGRTANPA
jgi:PAS domain S-box-containing protein